jgi:RNA exonuclease 1
MQDSGDLARLELERRFQLHATPPGTRPSHRLAVALDCEMGTAFDGDSELIRLTVIDFFTGEPLIDSLVYPDIKMAHFNTRWSGVTRGDMEQSRRQGRCLFGRDHARRALFKYVGPSTIVVGHGAQNDLSSLRWIHHRVVDSFMVESAVRKEAELKAEQKKKEEENEKQADEPKEVDTPKEGGPKAGRRRDKHHPDGMSLKALAMKRLGRAIQMGKKGHDSLEDALAARDLIQAHIMGIV